MFGRNGIATIFIFLAVLLPGKFPCAYAGPQNDIKRAGEYEISGSMVSSDGEGLAGASVTVTGTDGRVLKGVSADNTGHFSLRLDGGVYDISASFLGHGSAAGRYEIHADTVLNFVLEFSGTTVEEIVISVHGGRVHGVNMGVENLSPEFIRSMPAFFGEADVLKSLQMLPGVQATSEGGSGFSVRGGSHDQNLILLDDATLYNASHLMGFFSVFNNDVLDNVTLYKGDIPASFGGRLSSLLDVRTRDGQRERIAGSGGIGLIASRISLEGPLGSDKAGFVASARRTYADLFLKLSPDKDLRKSKLYFYDANMRLGWEPSPKDRIYLSGYFGRDKLGTTFAGMGFGNAAGSLKWSHSFSPKVFSTLSVNASRYNYKVTAKLGQEINQYWKSAMSDFGARAETLIMPGEGHSLRIGWNMILHRFRPGDMASKLDDPMLSEIRLPLEKALENGVYVSAESRLPWDVTVKYGLRVSFFGNIPDGKGDYKRGLYNRQSNFEPRVGLTKKVSANSSVKLSYSRMAQYIHIASNSAAGSPLDVWFQSSPKIKPQLSSQYSAGYYIGLGGGKWEFSFEGYYRNLSNTIDFRDHARLILNEHLEEEVLIGKGYAYGAELMLRRLTGRLQGWIGYSYGRSRRRTEGINDGLWYRSQFDKPHNLNLVLSYDLDSRWDISASWVYSTGTPVSFPTGRFIVEKEYVPIYEGRNRHRYPDYHRLDLAATFKLAPRREKYRSELSFSIYNAYGRKNPWMITFKEEDHNPNAFYAEQVYLFSVVPSVTWNFYF